MAPEIEDIKDKMNDLGQYQLMNNKQIRQIRQALGLDGDSLDSETNDGNSITQDLKMLKQHYKKPEELGIIGDDSFAYNSQIGGLKSNIEEL